MAILVDFNQVFLGTIFAQKDKVDEDLIRHTVLSCILSYKRKFAGEFGDIIICCDGQHYWRKTIFPYYKANRKKKRESSTHDWKTIFEALNKIRDELINNMPYRVVIVEHTEADDIIAVLVKEKSDVEFGRKAEPMLILSSDKDFIQLHKYYNVRQYSPVQKKFLVENNPVLYLKEKILRGDEGDGIPNFLSDGDTFVNQNKRQKPLRDVMVEQYLTKDLEEFTEEQKKNYIRNESLINLLDFIPENIVQSILDNYNSQNPTRKKMMNYFMKFKLKHLMESITEF